MDLTTLARVKVLLEAGGHSETPLDGLISQAIAEVSQQVGVFLDRHLDAVERTEDYDLEPGSRVVMLRGFPVVASPAPVVKNDLLRSFGSDTIVVATWYAVRLDNGVISFDQYVPTWGPGVLRVTYTGGFAAGASAGDRTTAFVAAYPDLAGAVERQVAHLLQRRRAFGAQSQAMGAGNVGWEGGYQWLPDVRQALEPYRRF